MNTLRIAVPGLLAALALAGCSDGTTETESTVVVDVCVERGIVCDDTSGGIACDPADGRCKCGGKGGVICARDMVCDLDASVEPPSATCISPLCADVTCKAFEACDAADGRCKCDGELCGEGQTCLAGGCSDEDPCAGVVCGDNLVCDPSDRNCKCGGSICSVGESCRLGDGGAGQCVGRKCVGKNCADGTVCNPVDGLCHCGSAEGDVCTTGQACEVKDGKNVCTGRDICEDVACTGHTVCSPLDGKCHCGGYATTDPVCADDQSCDLDQDPPRCVGGDICEGVTCEAGTNLWCDGESGECRCGGNGGLACASGQGCVDSGGSPTCVTRCDPSDVKSSICGTAKGCYLSPADGMAYCADAGFEPEGEDCRKPTDCVAGHHCVQSGSSSSGVCRQYCNVNVLGSCSTESRACSTLTPELGVCLVVSQ